ncbi:MAG: radical SAM protein [Candidatus Aminicenantes bacterium]|nr:radical SAM protein [Candidatus Aminicenantes bacterium]
MTRLDYYRRLWKIFRGYRGKRTRLSYLPVRLWVEPTSVCNLRCLMCPNKDLPREQKGFMDFGLFRKIIDEAKDFIFDVHLLHRGESLLHPDFFRMVRYAREAGISTRFHTNGTLLDEDKSRRLIEAGLDQFALSFDGFDAPSYESIRVNAKFEATISNIRRFLEIKREMGAKRPSTTIELIHFPNVFAKGSRPKRRAFLERFRGLPLDHVHVKELHNWAGQAGPAGARGGYSACTFLWHALIIFWDGSVLPCTQDFFGYYPLGNVKEDSIRTIWNNERMIRLRTKILARDVADLETCGRCDRLRRPRIFGIPREYLGRALLKKMN